MADLQEADNSAPETPEMSDTIRATLREINSRSAEPPSAVPPITARSEPAAVEAAEAGDVSAAPLDKPAESRARGADGKFVKTDDKPVEAKPDAAASKEPVKQAFVPKWKKEALEKWAALDPTVQGEVERREQDFHKGIEQYKTQAQDAQAWQQTLSPYAATLQSLRMPPQQAVGMLLAAEHALRNGTQQQKLAMIQTLVNDYGIQLPTGDEAAQPAPQTDPAVQQVYQRVAQLENMLMQRQQQEATAQEAEVLTHVQAFAASHPYHETLKPMMAALLQTNQAENLEDAYGKAFLLHPATKAVAEAQQREKWEKERQAKAEAARKAGSVNVRPRGTMPSTEGSTGDMRDTIARVARSTGLIN